MSAPANQPVLKTATKRRPLLTSCALAAALAALNQPIPSRAQNYNGVGFSGVANVAQGSVDFANNGPNADTIQVNSGTAIINWAPTDTDGSGTIDFLPAGKGALFTNNPDTRQNFTVLNRVVPTDTTRPIALNGAIVGFQFGDPSGVGGNVYFYSPGGIIVGSTAQIAVGSLVLTTNDIVSGLGTGTLGFKAETAGTRAAVTIQGANAAGPGAQITANNFIAMVAPRINQGGLVRAGGSVAYVAADAADITINNGLFDIAVTDGAAVDDPGDPALTHTGTTSGPTAASGTQAPRAIYMVAIPKNDAISMLVGGTVGYDAASSASVVNGVVVLSSGQNVTSTIVAGEVSTQFGTPAGATGESGLRIEGGTFTSRVEGVATGSIAANGGGGALSFSDNVRLTAGGDIAVAALLGETVDFAGDLSLTANNQAADGSPQKSTATVRADGGALAIDGNLLIVADAFADVAAATGGDAAIRAVNAGTVTVGGAATLSASGFGGTGSGATGATGTGGNAAVTATTGGQITITGQTSLTADGSGGGTGPTGGNGVGGTVTVSATGASIALDGGLEANARGFGVGGNGLAGGTGRGGTINIRAIGDADTGVAGTLTASTIDLFADGTGGEADGAFGNGGNGIGGTVSIATGANGSISATSFLNAHASGYGGAGSSSFSSGQNAGNGGRAAGGSISVQILAGTLSAASLSFNASAAGGSGGSAFADSISAGNGGNSRSGVIAVAAFGTIQADLIRVEITDQGGAGGSAIDGAAGDGGRAMGGTIAIGASDDGLISGTASSSAGTALSIFASSSGGNGGASGNAGTGNGGDVEGSGIAQVMNSGTMNVSSLTISGGAQGGSAFVDGTSGGNASGFETGVINEGGTLNVGSLTLRSTSRGGSAFGADGRGGDARGSGADILIDGVVTIDDNLIVEATGYGGAGDIGGIGRGGGASLLVGVLTNDATFNYGGTSLTLLSRGFGGDSNASGETAGAAFGGNIDFGTAEAQTLRGTVLLDASATGGNAAFGGTGGAATGGDIEVSVIGIGSSLSIVSTLDASGAPLPGGLTLIANGNGGAGRTGGAGTGGRVSVEVHGDSLNVDGDLTIAVNGSGGQGTDGGAGAAGRGGQAIFIASGFSSTTTTSTTISGAFSLEASGFGGNATSSGSPDGPGNGGAGTGGTATLSFAGGTIGAAGTSIAAIGTGGYSLTGGTFGAGTGGTAQALIGDADAVATTATLGALTLDARGLSGGNGAIDGLFGSGGAGTGGTASAAFVNAAVTTAALNVTASGTGSNATSPFSGAFDGGTGTGGTARLDLTDATLTSSAAINLQASGFGGGGTGGGNGGAGIGGGAAGTPVTAGAYLTLTGADAEIDATSIGLTAFGSGGDGGDGPTNGFLEDGGNGGAGGAGRGGAVGVTVTDGSLTPTNVLSLVAVGFGGDGGTSTPVGNDGADTDAVGGAGGAGGAATGGTATIRTVGTAEVVADLLSLSVEALGGLGRAGSDGGVGGGGGIGGAATAGSASIIAEGGTLQFGNGEALEVALGATGGNGGAGGNGSVVGDSGGVGGNGGAAIAGQLQVVARGGTITSAGAIAFTANATGGDGGVGGIGSGAPAIPDNPDTPGDESQPAVPATPATNGIGGLGQGGTLSLRTENGTDGTSFGTIDLGDVTLTAGGQGGFGLTQSGDSQGGRIEVYNLATDPDAIFRVNSLTARTLGFANTSDQSIDIFADTAQIQVRGDLRAQSAGSVYLRAAGTGNIFVVGSATLDAAASVIVSHDAQTDTPTDTFNAASIRSTSGLDFSSAPGSIVRSRGDLAIFAFNTADIANATAAGNILVSALNGITVDTLTGTGLVTGAGSGNSVIGGSSIRLIAGAVVDPSAADIPALGNADIRITGIVSTTNAVRATAGGSITVDGDAVVRSDNSINLAAGNDVLLSATSVVRGAFNPVADTGGTGDLDTDSAAAVVITAGRQTLAYSPDAGNVSSIVADGTILVQSDDGTQRGPVVLGAGAVDVSGQIRARTLSVEVDGAPLPGTGQLDDNGLLDGACLQGDVCLGDLDLTNLLRVSGGSDGNLLATNVTIRGLTGINATDADIRALGNVTLGGFDGVTGWAFTAGDIRIEAQGGSVSLLGDAFVRGTATDTVNILAATGIDAAGATISSAGTLGLYIGTGDLVVDTLRADGQFVTLASDGTIVANNQLILPGEAVIGTVITGTGNIAINSAAGIDIGSAFTTNSIILTSAGQIALDSALPSELGIADAISINGSSVTVGTLQSDGLISLISNSGGISADSLTGGSASLSATGGNVAIGSAGTTGNMTIFATGNAVTSSGTLDAGNDLFVSAGSIDLATATAFRDLTLNASATIDAATLTAGDDIRLNGGAITVASATTRTGFGGDSEAGYGADGRNIVIQGDTVQLTTGNAVDGIFITADTGPAGSSSLVAGGDVSVTSFGGALALGLIDAGGSAILFTSGGAINATDIDAGTDIGITANGAIVISSADAGGNASIQGDGAVTLLAGGSAGGDFGIDAGGPLTITGTLRGGDDISLRSLTTLDAGALVTTGLGADSDDNLPGSSILVDAATITTGSIISADRIYVLAGSGGANLGAVTGDAFNLFATGDISVDTLSATGFNTVDADLAVIQAGALVLGGQFAGGTVTIRGAAPLDIRAASGVDIDTARTANNGTIALSSTGGAIDLGGVASTGTGRVGTVRLTGVSVNATDLDVSQDIAINATGSGYNGAILSAGDDISITTAGDIVIGGIDAGDALVLSGATIDANELIAGGTSTIASPGSIAINSINSQGFATVTSTGDAVSVGAITTPAGGTFSAAADLTVGTLNSGGLLTLTGFNVTVQEDITDVDNLAITTQNNLTLSDVTLGGDLTVTVPNLFTAGTITLDGSMLASAATIDIDEIDAANDITLTGTSALSVDVLTAGDDIRLSGGTISSFNVQATGLGTDNESGSAAGSSIFATSTDRIGLETATAATDIQLTANGAGGAITLVIGAARDIGLTTSGQASGLQVDARRNLSINAGSVDYDQTTANGNLTIAADTVTIDGLVRAQGDLSLTGGTLLDVTLVNSGGDATLTFGQTADIGIVNAAGNATIGSNATDPAVAALQTATIGSVGAGGDLTITAVGPLRIVNSAGAGGDGAPGSLTIITSSGLVANQLLATDDILVRNVAAPGLLPASGDIRLVGATAQNGSVTVSNVSGGISASDTLSAGSALVANAAGDLAIGGGSGLSVQLTTPGNMTLGVIEASSLIDARAGGNIAIQDATVTLPVVAAPGTATIASGGQISLIAGDGVTAAAADLTVTGTIDGRASVNLEADRDIIVASGATVSSDNTVVASAGDDILVRTGGTIRGGVAPILDATDPGGPAGLFQAAGVTLRAGRRGSDNFTAAGNTASVILNGTVGANRRPLLIEAGAITANSAISGRDIDLRIFDAPAAGAAGNDGGQLAIGCFAGNICLADIDGTFRNVAIGLDSIDGTNIYLPNQVRIGGDGWNSQQTFIRALGTISIGDGTTPMLIGATGNISLESLAGGLLFSGPIQLASGPAGGSIEPLIDLRAATGINGPTTSINAGGQLFVQSLNGDIALGNVISPESINIVSAGALSLGSVQTGDDVLLAAATTIDTGAITAADYTVLLAGTDVNIASSTTGGIFYVGNVSILGNLGDTFDPTQLGGTAQTPIGGSFAATGPINASLVTVNADGAIDTGAISSQSVLSLVTTDGDIATGALTAPVLLQVMGGGDVDIASAVGASAINLFSSGGNVTAGTVISAGGKIQLQATGDVTATGLVDAGVDVTVNAGGAFTAGVLVSRVTTLVDDNFGIGIWAGGPVQFASASSQTDIGVGSAAGVNLGTLTTPGSVVILANGNTSLGSVNAGQTFFFGSIAMLEGLDPLSTTADDIIGASPIPNLGSFAATGTIAADDVFVYTRDLASFATVDANTILVRTLLGGISATSLIAGGTIDLGTGGAITAGTLDAGGAVTATAGGNLTVADLSAGAPSTLTGLNVAITGPLENVSSIQLNAVNAITLADVDISGTLSAAAGGAFSAGNVAADAGIDVTAGSVGLANGSTGGALTLIAVGGGVSADALTAGGAVQIGSPGAIAIDTINGSTTVDVASLAGPVNLGTVTSDALMTLVSGGLLDVDAIDAGGGLSATAGGNLTVGTLAAAAPATLAGINIAVTGAIQNATSVQLTAANAITLANVDISGTLTAGAGGAFSAGDVSADAGIGIAAASVTLLDGTTNGGLALAAATGAITTDALSAGVIQVSGPATITIASANAVGTADIASVAGPLDLGSIASGAAMTLTSGGAIGVDAIDAGGGVTATAATDLTVGSFTAGAASVFNGFNVSVGSAITDATDLEINAVNNLTLTSVILSGDFDATIGGRFRANEVETGGGIDITAGDVFLGRGSARSTISINALAGNVVTGSLPAGQGVSVRAAGNINILDSSTGGDFTATAGGNFFINIVAPSRSAIIQAGGDATINSAFVGSPVSGTGDLSVSAGDDIAIGEARVQGGLTLTSATGSITTDILTANSIDMTAAGAITTEEPTTGRGAVRITSIAGPLDLGEIASGGATTLTSGGAIDVDAIDAAGGATVTAATNLDIGAFTAGAPSVFNGFNVSVGSAITDATDLEINAVNNLALTNVRLSGDFDVTIGGLLTANNISSNNIDIVAGRVQLGSAFAQYNDGVRRGSLTITTTTGDIVAGSLAAEAFSNIAAAGNADIGSLGDSRATIGANGNVDLGEMSGRSLAVTAGGDVAVGRASVDQGDITITAGGGATLGNLLATKADPDVPGSIVISTNGDIVIASADAIGTILLTSSNGAASGGSLFALGDIGMRDSSGNIALIRNGIRFESVTAGANLYFRTLGDVNIGMLGGIAGDRATIVTETPDLAFGTGSVTLGDVRLNESLVVRAVGLVGIGTAVLADDFTTSSIDISAGGPIDIGTATAANAITLRTTSGAIAADLLRAGPMVQSSPFSGTIIVASDTGPLDLGSISSRLTTTLTSGGAIDVDAINARGGATVTAATDLTVGSFTAGAPSVFNGFNVSVGSAITDATALEINAVNNLTLTSVTLSDGFTATIGGLLTATSIVSGDDIQISAGSVQLGSGTAANAIDIEALTGGITAGSLDAGLAITLQAAGTVDVGTATSGRDVLVVADGDAILDSITASGNIGIDAGGVATIGFAQALGELGYGAGNLSVSTDGDIAITEGRATGSIILTSSDGTASADTLVAGLDIGARDVNGDIVLVGNGIDFGTIEAGRDILLTGYGNVDIASATAGDDFVIEQSVGGDGAVFTETVTIGSVTAADLLAIDTGGNLAITTARAQTALLSSFGDVGVGTLTAASATLQTSTPNADFGTGLVTLDAATISGNLLIRSAGATSVGTATVGGIIDVESQGSVTRFADIRAGSDIEVDTAGGLTAGTVVSTGGDVDFETVGSVIATSLTAGHELDIATAAGDVSVGTAVAGTQAGPVAPDNRRSIGIRATGNVTVGSATSAVDIGLAAGGIITADTVVATDNVVLLAGTDVNLGSLSTDGLFYVGNVSILPALGPDYDPAVLASVPQTPIGGAFTATGPVSAGAIRLAATNGIGFGAMSADGSALLRATTGPIDGDSLAANAVSIVSQSGALTLGSVSAVSGIDVATGGAVDIGTATAGTSIDIEAGGAVAVDTASANDAIGIDAGGAIALGTATANRIQLTSVSNVAANLLRTIGGSAGLANAGDVSVGAGGTIAIARILSVGDVTLQSSGGPVTVSTDLVAAGAINARGTAVDLTAIGGLQVASAVATAGDVRLRTGGNTGITLATATGTITVVFDGIGSTLAATSLDAGGDIVIDANGAVAAGALTAGGSIAIGDLNTNSPTTLSVDNATAGQDIAMFASVSMDLGTLAAGGSMDLQTTILDPSDVLPRSITIDSATAGNDLYLGTFGALVVGSATTTGDGTLFLGSSTSIDADTVNGADRVELFLNPVSPSGFNVGDARGGIEIASLRAGGDIVGNNSDSGFTLASTIAGGSITLDAGASTAGDVVIGNMIAGGAIAITDQGTVRLTGNVGGPTIRIASLDIDIGSTANVGSVPSPTGAAGDTQSILLTNIGDTDTNVGGNGVGETWSLSNAEFGRIAAHTIEIDGQANDVTIARLDVIGAAGADTAARRRNLTGSDLIIRGNDILVNGALALTAAGSDDSVSLIAANEIFVDTAGGSIVLSGANGGLGGTLNMTGDTIFVGTAQARSDIAGMATVDEKDERLGDNDGEDNRDGFIRANGMTFTAGSGLYIQNTGIDRQPSGDRGGFTVGSGGIAITTAGSTATGSTPTEIIINGRIRNADGSFVTGRDIIPLLDIDSSANGFDPRSTANGCLILGESCRFDVVFNPNANIDVLDMIDMIFSQSSIFNPVVPVIVVAESNVPPFIVEPVTGTANDDLIGVVTGTRNDSLDTPDGVDENGNPITDEVTGTRIDDDTSEDGTSNTPGSVDGQVGTRRDDEAGEDGTSSTPGSADGQVGTRRDDEEARPCASSNNEDATRPCREDEQQAKPNP